MVGRECGPKAYSGVCVNSLRTQEPGTTLACTFGTGKVRFSTPTCLLAAATGNLDRTGTTPQALLPSYGQFLYSVDYPTVEYDRSSAHADRPIEGGVSEVRFSASPRIDSRVRPVADR